MKTGEGVHLMRITSHMLSLAEQKLGLSVSRRSLLDFINSEKNGNSLLNALSSKKGSFSDTLNRAKYEKLEKTAEELEAQAKKMAEGSEKDDLYAETEKLAKTYNSLLDAMSRHGGALNSFYRQNLKDIAVHDEELLRSVGISVQKDGTLEVDKDKLSAASLEELKKAVGADSDFAAKLSYISSKIADNAEANAKSYSSGYLPNGNITSNYQSKYDFRS